MLKIMVTNDDGIRSKGLTTLAEALKPIADVWVVAPEGEMSAVSHSVTLHRPLRVKEFSHQAYSVDGTPTDCVNLGVHAILKTKPHLIVSGINKGGNLGGDITYSGTVSAAMEGTLLGIPSFAISLVTKKDFQFETAAGFAASLAEHILKKGLPPGIFLNVNVPNGEVDKTKPYAITRQGKRIHGDCLVEKTDPRGEKYYWMGDNDLVYEDVKESDYQSIAENRISITPLQMDLTGHAFITELSKWSL